MSRAALALLVFVVYGAVTFGLRSWQHRRATGHSGVVGLSAPFASPAGIGGLLFVLGAVLGPLAPVAAMLGWLGPLLTTPDWVAAIGLALALTGVAATYTAQLAMGRSWRIGVQEAERTALVTSGPFRVVRNPIFSCMLLTSTGLAILLPSSLMLASLVCFAAGIELHVRRVEEPHLLRVHGTAYADYCARVGRFIPGIGRRRAG